MGHARLVICALLAAVLAGAAGASAASAATLYITKSGNDTNACTSPSAPCLTISAAIAKSELLDETSTLDIGPGTYEETVELGGTADGGLILDGAGAGAGGTEILAPAAATHPAIGVDVPEANLTIENLSVVSPKGESQPGIESGADLTLDNVNVTMTEDSGEAGIVSEEIGSLTMNGGGVTMTGANDASAVSTFGTSLSMNGATLTLSKDVAGDAIQGVDAPVSVSNTTVNITESEGTSGIGAGLGPVALNGDTINQGSTGSATGVVLEFPDSGTVNGLTISMSNKEDDADAVEEELGTASFEHLQVGGIWSGVPFEAVGGSVTLADSRLTSGSATGDKAPVLLEEGLGEGAGVLIQRSVLQTNAEVERGAILAENGNLTVDSSEILGGSSGIYFGNVGGRARTLTVDGSTIDAGAPGVSDASPVEGIHAFAANLNSIANVNIEGSILFEQQFSEVGPGAKEVNVRCDYSDVPSQAQAAAPVPGDGTIACQNGEAGNSNLETLTSLFTAPVTSYGLNPASPAVNSVPSSAIVLPAGESASPTDLAGNPRTVQIGSNGVCSSFQDRGALQVPGQGSNCPPAKAVTPPAPVAAAVAGVISGLTLSPSTFYPAPSGATISVSKQYGTQVSYRDSQAATTTFTVLSESAGRKQGRSCERPSRRNTRGKHCTILTSAGTFTHSDAASARVKLHFSGRVKGKRLPAGHYRLRAVAHDAAGNGAAAFAAFTIR